MVIQEKVKLRIVISDQRSYFILYLLHALIHYSTMYYMLRPSELTQLFTGPRMELSGNIEIIQFKFYDIRTLF